MTSTYINYTRCTLAKQKHIRKSKNLPEQNTKNIKDKSSVKSFNVASITYFLLFLIFVFSFYIRGIVPMKNVFSNGVGFAMDDSVFHMRLVENTIQYFPHRIFYDAFTQYPLGNPLHWGPLFDQLIAFFALISGFIFNGGIPAQSTIDTVGAFFPAVVGALVVFPVYFIGKELMDEKAGLLGAFLIAILPGQFLSRSVLGFTDNHVLEVFFLTLMMMFFIIAIKRAQNITFDHWQNKEWNVLKTPLIFSILAGISFGAYILTWTSGVFFAVVFGIFIFIQYIIDHLRGKSTEYLGIVGITAYLVAMIMVIPYVDPKNGFQSIFYSYLHLAVTGGGAIVFAFLSFFSREMNKREYTGSYYLLFLSGTILIGLIVIKILLPDLYGATIGATDFIFKGREGGGLTIAEGSPLCGDISLFSLFNCNMAFRQFGFNYQLTTIGMLVLGYFILRKPKAEYTLIAVWSVFVLAIMLAQNRFAYYYAVNVAVVTGFIGSKFLDLLDWKKYDSNDFIECLKKTRVQHVISLILVLAVIGFLPVDASPFKNSCGSWPWSCASTQWGAIGEGQYEWHDALTWMRYNTPDPGLDYYSIYEKPLNNTYPYPDTAYGVMSWWDYGHIITYWGHRIPNSNPFQAAIGGGPEHLPGAATFLIAPTEEKANEVLNKLGINGKPGARYVVSNAYMAYAILGTIAEWDLSNEGYYVPIRTQQGTFGGPSIKYLNTIEAKLHIFDTYGLHNYRLVHESNPAPYYRGGNEEKFFKYVSNSYGGDIPNLPIEDSGYAKIFEFVKGANIKGRAPPNSIVTISNTIKTNIGRTIQYSQTTTSSSDGTYVFTVPYSTKGPIAGETNFDTKPEGPYTVTAGNFTKQVDIEEMDVLDGGTVTLDLKS